MSDCSDNESIVVFWYQRLDPVGDCKATSDLALEYGVLVPSLLPTTTAAAAAAAAANVIGCESHAESNPQVIKLSAKQADRLFGGIECLYQQESGQEAELWRDKTVESIKQSASKGLAMFVALNDNHVGNAGASGSDSTGTCDSDAGHILDSGSVAAFATVCGDRKDPLLEDIIVGAQYRKRGIARTLLELVAAPATTAAAAPTSSVSESTCASLADILCDAPHIDLYCAEHLEAFYNKCKFTRMRDPINGRHYMRRKLNRF
jgi:hypothetical protein